MDKLKSKLTKTKCGNKYKKLYTKESAINSKCSLRCNTVYLENEIGHNISLYNLSFFIFYVCSTILVLNNFLVQVRNFYHE